MMYQCSVSNNQSASGAVLAPPLCSPHTFVQESRRIVILSTSKCIEQVSDHAFIIARMEVHGMEAMRVSSHWVSSQPLGSPMGDRSPLGCMHGVMNDS